MAEPAEKMLRKQFLITPATAKRLEEIAAKRGTSASEVVRQAINSFDANDSEAMESAELMDLVSVRLKEAIRSTRTARKVAAKALTSLSVRAV